MIHCYNRTTRIKQLYEELDAMQYRFDELKNEPKITAIEVRALATWMLIIKAFLYEKGLITYEDKEFKCLDEQCNTILAKQSEMEGEK